MTPKGKRIRKGKQGGSPLISFTLPLLKLTVVTTTPPLPTFEDSDNERTKILYIVVGFFRTKGTSITCETKPKFNIYG